METFYSAWVIVQQFIAADAKVPKEAMLPTTAQRMVAKLLEDRRLFPIIEVIEALAPIAQPELLETKPTDRPVESTRNENAVVETLIAPVSRVLTT